MVINQRSQLEILETHSAIDRAISTADRCIEALRAYVESLRAEEGKE